MPKRRAPGDGSIYHDTSGGRDRWVGAITIAGTRRKVSAHNKTEARKKLDALREAAGRGEVVDGSVTVGSLVDQWEGRALAGRQLAPSTRDTYAWCAAVIRDNLGNTRLRALTPEDVEAMLDRLANDRTDGRPLGHAALVKVRGTLAQILDYAMRRGIATRNVARIADLTPNARRGNPRATLDVDGVRRLVEVLNGERLGSLYLLSAMLGLRPGEAAGVCWNDLDLEARTVTLRHAVRLEHGRPVLVDVLKTPQSRRTLGLPEIVVDALHRQRRAQVAERLAAADWVANDLVFTTRTGTPVNAANMRRQLVRICQQNGLPNIKPNELRHTAASVMADAGVPLIEIADQLGHSSTRMLEMTYRHRLNPIISAAVNVMDRAIGGTP